MNGRQNLRLAISGCALATAILLLPDELAAQTASSEVGVVLATEGDIVATLQSRAVPVKEYSVLVDGMTLKLAAKAQLRFVHNKERVTYVIAGPASVTISQMGVAAEPSKAIFSRTSSRLAVEMAAPGAAPASRAPSSLRIGGESLDNTRAGLAGSPKSARSEPAKVEPAPKAAVNAPRMSSRSEREAQRDAEVAAKAIGKPAEQVAAASPSVAAPTSAPAAKAGVSEGEALYRQALAMESSGKAADAVRIYRRAARAGNGKAAKRLGDIFDRGVPGVSRDYAESLQWYQTARDLGEEVPVGAAR